MRRRNTNVTVPQPTLPSASDPLWLMGFEHVERAHAICALLSSLVAATKKGKV
jgi:hypothetical protein